MVRQDKGTASPGAARSSGRVDVRPGSWLAGSARVLQGPGLFRGLPASGFAQIAGRRTAQDTVTQPCGSRDVETPGSSTRSVFTPPEINVVTDVHDGTCRLSLLQVQPKTANGLMSAHGAARCAAVRLPNSISQDIFLVRPPSPAVYAPWESSAATHLPSPRQLFFYSSSRMIQRRTAGTLGNAAKEPDGPCPMP